MKRKISNLLKGICLTMMCAFSINLLAQNITVTGTISDTAGEPLIGVTVRVQGESIGTVTDLDGQFTFLNVPPDATLLVTYIGMQPQTILMVRQPIMDPISPLEKISATLP